jgi:hypothetical protein
VTRCQDRRRPLFHRRSLEAQKTGLLQLQQRMVLKTLFIRANCRQQYRRLLCRRSSYL